MGQSTFSGPYGRRYTPPLRKCGEPLARAAPPDADERSAAALLAQVFRRMPGSLTLRLWSGAEFEVGADPRAVLASAPFVLVFRNPEAVASLVLGRDPLRIAEAYFCGDLDIEGDLYAALGLRNDLEALQLPLTERVRAVIAAMRLRAGGRRRGRRAPDAAPSHGLHIRAPSREENRSAIRFHYDVSNGFYRLWPDPAMAYSCAYFERADMPLEDAQQAKLEHVCRKLMLRPGERLLDVGCGWGALVIHAARHHGVHAHGITLSEKQLRVARERIAEAGLEDRASVDLVDYRDLDVQGVYDKVASIGMFEHVGLDNLPLYFACLYRSLKPDGLLLNHGITHAAAGWDSTVSTRFINRYVFPDGELDTISNIEGVMERAGFEISDVESLRPHYALTLRSWVDRLERGRDRALEYVNEATYRVWRLYMAACALEFEAGDVGVYQVLASKRGARNTGLPLTRRDWYRD